MVGSSESNVACMVGSPRNFQTNLAYDIIDEEPEEEELELESEKNPGKSPKPNRSKLSLERSPNLDRSSSQVSAYSRLKCLFGTLGPFYFLANYNVVPETRG